MSLQTSFNYAFIDVETTGLYPDIHEVIEIACIIVDRGNGGPGDLKVLKELEIKVKPEHLDRAQPEALRINGYDEGAWIFAHTQEQAFREIAEACKGCVFVAHNVAFDWGFMEASFRRHNIEHGFKNNKLDTLSIAFAKFNGTDDIKHLSLRALAEHFGIQNERAHSALPDTRVMFQIFKKLMEMKG